MKIIVFLILTFVTLTSCSRLNYSRRMYNTWYPGRVATSKGLLILPSAGDRKKCINVTPKPIYKY